MLEQALILAGGFGTRLGELAKSTPKPMLLVDGRPFLEHVVWNLRRHGISDIVFSVGHLSQAVVDHFGDGSRFGIHAHYVVEEVAAGTAGALLLAKDELKDTFLVLNGDTLFDCNPLDLYLALKDPSVWAAMALRRVPDVGRYGSVELDGGKVSAFLEKGRTGPGLISGGVYAMRREAIGLIDKTPCSLETDVFPKLVEQQRLAAKAYDGFFIDIGLPETLDQAQTEVAQWRRRRPATFLDRDGVINRDHGHVFTSDKFDWNDGAIEAIRFLNDAGYLVIVVTNQAGIAKGYYTEEQFLELAAWIQQQLQAHGAHIDATYFCPHHPTEGQGKYLQVCECRKPGPGMLKQAMAEWDIDPGRSFLIGDKESDIQAAQAAGVRGTLFAEGNLRDIVQAEHDKNQGAYAR